MDPYIEASGHWRDFHLEIISEFRAQLARLLPDDYVSRIDERLQLVSYADRDGSAYPDVAIVRGPMEPQDESDDPGGGTAVATAPATVLAPPVVIPIVARQYDELEVAYIDIFYEPDEQLVTSIEVMSPSNKADAGRAQYLAKRDRLQDQRVHLVELDLLVGGRRLPMREPPPRGDYYAYVSRAERRPLADVYAWGVRDRLPAIPVPLKAPDPDVALDVADAVAAAYERANYARSLRRAYGDPLDLPLSAADRAWAEAIARPPAKGAAGQAPAEGHETAPKPPA